MKKINFKSILTLLAILFTSSLIFAQSINQGMIAWYPFNGNTSDLSGNNRNLTSVNTAFANDKDGRSSSSLYFNGSSAYCYGVADTGFSPNEITISAWVKSEGIQKSNARTLTVGPDNKINGNYTFWFEQGLQSLGFISAEPVTNTASIYNYSTGTYTADSWCHIAVTFSNSTKELKFFINGVLDKKHSNSGSLTGFTSSRNISVGVTGYPTSLNSYFKGWMDDLRLYNRALTDNEISSLYSFNLGEFKQVTSNSKISFYPNPVSEKLYINVPNEQSYSLSILSSEGKLIQNINILNQSAVEIGNLSSGLYFLSFTNNKGETFVEKFVKQ